MLCQSCSAYNDDDREFCFRCQNKLLVLSGITAFEEAEIEVVERVLTETGATLSSLAPGLFKEHITPEVVERELDRRGAIARRLPKVSRIAARIERFGPQIGKQLMRGKSLPGNQRHQPEAARIVKGKP